MSRPFLKIIACLVVLCLGIWAVDHVKKDGDLKKEGTLKLGGDTSVQIQSSEAFTFPAGNVSNENRRIFFFGNFLFNNKWATAPGSVKTLDGLGPVFNRNSCSGCHLRDGRGQPPKTPNESMESMLIRISRPGVAENGGVVGDPVYGDQIENNAIMGVSAEGDPKVSYKIIKGQYPDGSAYSLAQPEYKMGKLAFGPLPADIMTSPRVAPQMIGLGLLEAIPEKTILALADPEDKNHDGIKGKPNYVWDQSEGKKRLGRFGWKANQPSIMQQDAGALSGDIGITTPIFPNENCTDAQAKCKAAINGGTPEMSPEFLKKLTTYTQLLGVPVRRHVDDPEVMAGEALFTKVQCSSCHIPTLKTGDHELHEVSYQTIHPFTDLLLHDMGPALADGRPDFEASGSQWRTAPLWGVGLFKMTDGHTRYLHDGRARNLEEAVLWHGGEAENAKQSFINLNAEKRGQLLKFLQSL